MIIGLIPIVPTCPFRAFNPLLEADELDRDEVDPDDDGEREESLDESEDGLQPGTDEPERAGDRTGEHHPAQRQQEALGAVPCGVVAWPAAARRRGSARTDAIRSGPPRANTLKALTTFSAAMTGCPAVGRKAHRVSRREAPVGDPPVQPRRCRRLARPWSRARHRGPGRERRR